VTVPNTNYVNNYTGDGSTTSFSYNFAVQYTSQVQVYLAGVLQNSGYTNSISLTGIGGTVTFTTAPGSGVAIQIIRNSDYLQTNVFQDNQPLNPAVLMQSIDKLTVLAQQLQVLLEGTPSFPATSGVTNGLPTTAGSSYANYIVGLDPTGLIWSILNPVTVFQNAFPNAGAGNVVGPASSVVNNIATYNATNGQLIKDSGIAISGIYSSSNLPPVPVSARAYLVSASPLADGSSSGNATIYVGPSTGLGKYHTYDNGSGVLTTAVLTECSLSISGLLSGTAYSLFLYNNAGTWTLEADAWSGVNTPLTYGSDALGRLCKSGSTNKLLVAEFTCDATGTVYNYTGARRLANVFNKIQAALASAITASSWTYTSQTIRASDANTTIGQGRIPIFVSSVGSPFSVAFSCAGSSSASEPIIGIGVDSTTAFSSGSVGIYATANADSMTANYSSNSLSTGAHYLQMLEAAGAGGTSTFYGAWSALGFSVSGNTCFMSGSIWQ